MISLISSGADAVPGPQAFLFSSEPFSVSSPHFHIENQFQIVVSGSGTLGRQAVAPVTVHYAQRDVGYGPINAHEQGLAYMTLRPRMDPGSLALPQNRHVQRPVLPARHFTVGPIAPSDAATLRTLDVPEVQTLIDETPDHLAAWCVRFPPGATALAPGVPAGEGRFYVVAAGSLISAAEEWPRLSCIFADPGEAQPELRGGDAGLELLVLQFPDDPVSAAENYRAGHAKLKRTA